MRSPGDHRGTDRDITGESLVSVEDEKERDMTMDIMMLLDSSKVHHLREEFEKVEEGLSLFQFVKVMKKFLMEESVGFNDEHVVANLCELFAQIDINGDGCLEVCKHCLCAFHVFMYMFCIGI